MHMKIINDCTKKIAKIHPDGFNYVILTEEMSNLLVVDIDIKDNGMEEFQEYVEECGIIQTLHVASPRNALHSYFKYTSSNYHNNEMIRDYMKNKTSLRGVGIDVRSNGGFIMGPGSIVKDKSYGIAAIPANDAANETGVAVAQVNAGGAAQGQNLNYTFK
jgi:hypothetical protein